MDRHIVIHTVKYDYRPRSRGDNTFGNVCLFVRMCVIGHSSSSYSNKLCFVRQRSHLSTGAEWSILVLGFAKYSKRSSEIQVSYTLKNLIEFSSQGAFKMVGQSKWSLFQQVAPSRSITLLILTHFWALFLVGFHVLWCISFSIN